MDGLLPGQIDPLLSERIARVATARGWSLEEATLRLLEQGLLLSEQEIRGGFGAQEVDALAEAIAALKGLPVGSSY